jgi:hypothetical protein
MSSLLKRFASEALAERMREILPPALGVSVKVAAAADPEEKNDFPSLKVLPQSFTFTPLQELEVDDTNPDLLLSEVGEFEGMVEIRISARNLPEREAIQDAVMQAFLEPELSPGVITLATDPPIVNGVQLAKGTFVSFQLDSEDWRDELAFSKKRYTFLECTAQFPALIVRNVKTINELILALEVDLNDLNEPDAEIATELEDFVVQSDGTLVPTDL